MNISKDYDIKPLVLAVVTRAAKDANEGCDEARQWMADEAIVWLDGVGVDIHPDTIQRWTRKGYKIPARARQIVTA